VFRNITSQKISRDILKCTLPDRFRNKQEIFPYFCRANGFRPGGMKRESGASPEHYPML
jgi:hypothetical protein